MTAKALAVTRYTLLELSRRKVLLIIVLAGVLLVAGLGIAPMVIPGGPVGESRTLFELNALSSIVALAIQLCAFAIGMTIINHDLDSGSIVGILAKPINRVGYAAGKLVGAVALLTLLVVIFAVGTLSLVALNGGGHTAVLLAFFGAALANFLLLMVLVMILTVYLNNVVAAIIVFAFTIVQGIEFQLHTFVEGHFIRDPFWSGVIKVAYWIVPHPLVSNLQREIIETQLRLHPIPTPPGGFRGRAFDPLAGVPGASGAGDLLFWAAYFAVLCALLYLALRRKQV